MNSPIRSFRLIFTCKASNELIVIAKGGYIYKRHYLALSDCRKAALVGYHIQLASSMAVRELREWLHPGRREC